LIDENDNILASALIFTSYDRNQSGMEVLNMVLEDCRKSLQEVDCIVSTGYGRRALKISCDAVPEIICHALGTQKLYPAVRTIIDIGGQDSKIIALDEKGMIEKFEMNDKCAAGTGRFFEVLAGRLLNISMDELGPLSLQAKNPCTISSMCTIFAESEIISYLSEGKTKADIIAGMINSVARRVVAMGKTSQIQFKEPIILSGGVARNSGAPRAFADMIGKEVEAIENPQLTGAMGAALKAKDLFLKKEGAKA
jgi:predicted CoA-substrate-specific enzyme activase